MDQKEKKKSSIFHKQSLTSFITAFSFVIVVISGIMMFIVPPGRIASWTEWSFFGLKREEWGSIHIVVSILFAAIGIYHLIINWRVFINYIVSRVKHGLNHGRELLISLIIIIIFALGAYLQIFPFKQFLEFNDWVKTLWVTSPEFEPPIAHAEDMALNTFTERMGMNLSNVTKELEINGIHVKNTGSTLADIGHENDKSPMEIYMIIKKFEKPLPAAVIFTEEMIDQRFEGRGIGQKTLAQIARENNFDYAAMKKRLAAKGVDYKDNETLREAAEKQKTKMVPLQILKTALIE